MRSESAIRWEHSADTPLEAKRSNGARLARQGRRNIYLDRGPRVPHASECRPHPRGRGQRYERCRGLWQVPWQKPAGEPDLRLHLCLRGRATASFPMQANVRWSVALPVPKRALKIALVLPGVLSPERI